MKSTNLPGWHTTLWLLLSTVLIPAVLTISVGILILVFYRAPWDVAFGVLVLCFAVFAVTGSSITVFLLHRIRHLAEMQSEFIANISHDFRTPLTSIRMFVETLSTGRVQDPEQRQRCLELLSREAERMEHLVQRVLTFRQAETPQVAEHASYDPLELVERALRPFRIDAKLEERLSQVAEPQLPRVWVDGDAVLLALRALVDNALKYSVEHGPVVVTSRIDGSKLAISVRDSGPAIPRKEQRRIFRRFYRSPGSGKPGTGIGLAVASETAKAHGGRLELRSSSEVGNVFTLRLPIERAD